MDVISGKKQLNNVNIFFQDYFYGICIYVFAPCTSFKYTCILFNFVLELKLLNATLYFCLWFGDMVGNDLCFAELFCSNFGFFKKETAGCTRIVPAVQNYNI